MKRFAVYRKATGEIIRTGVCPDDHFALQARGEDEAVIEGAACDLSHHVAQGRIVEKPKKEPR